MFFLIAVLILTVAYTFRIDLDLNHVFLEEHEHNTWVDSKCSSHPCASQRKLRLWLRLAEKVVVVKDGKDAGTIHLKLKIVV